MLRRGKECRRCGIKYGALSDRFSADECTKAFNIPAEFKRGSDSKCTVCSKVEEGHWKQDDGELYCYDSSDHFRNGYKRCCLHYFGPKDEFETEAWGEGTAGEGFRLLCRFCRFCRFCRRDFVCMSLLSSVYFFVF